MSILKRLLGASERTTASESQETETVRKIAKALDQLEVSRARYIAAFAYLLGRVAHADTKISDKETYEMERLVRERTQLPPEQAVLVVEIAKNQNRLFGGTENFLVTRELNQVATLQEKLALADCLFAIGSSDHTISAQEESEIRQICSELKIDRKDYVALRSRYRDHLEVLRKAPE
ncbi:MAG: TerB family tellurite resistance protein [Acidobacteria bacterium]|nr:TerB family tellurite resistance protein [Acidobacteriota bacterium]